MRELTFTDVERLDAREAEEAFTMDEETFRAFYDRTARSVWLYLSRLTGDSQLSDDLLQETYYRFLRSGRAFEGEAHRRNYLFRIATNLVRDGQRRHRFEFVPVPEEHSANALTAEGDVAAQAVGRTDLSRAMAHLTSRERELLWLAYAQGASHVEIAGALGLKASSIKMLLFRARRRLGGLLHSGPASAAGSRSRG